MTSSRWEESGNSFISVLSRINCPPARAARIDAVVIAEAPDKQRQVELDLPRESATASRQEISVPAIKPAPGAVVQAACPRIVSIALSARFEEQCVASIYVRAERDGRRPAIGGDHQRRRRRAWSHGRGGGLSPSRLRRAQWRRGMGCVRSRSMPGGGCGR
jgi:hypothetical protein